MKGKISRVKFYSSIKASAKGGANTQLDYVDTAIMKVYDIGIDGNFIKIFNKDTEEVTYTTTNNVIYFTLMD